MRLRSLSALLALSLVALVPAATTPSEASCDTIAATYGDWFSQADAVFVGTALDVKDVPVALPEGEDPAAKFAEYTTRFRVDESYKGDLGDEVTVLGRNAWHDCLVEFEAGRRYVVFAFRRPWTPDPRHAASAALRSDLGSPTGPVDYRSDAVAYLRRRVVLGKAPTLVGAVHEIVPQSLGEPDRIVARGGVTVTLKSGDAVFSATSCADGSYAFDELPSGRYAVDVTLPEGVRAYGRSIYAPYVPLLPGSSDDEVTVADGEAPPRFFQVTSAASVAGRVTSASGAPTRDAYLHLVLPSKLATLDANRVDGNLRGWIEDDGRFAFETVPPGEYLIAVNPGSEDAFGSRGPTFYYPGVLDPAKAERVRVAAGERLDLGTIQAPPPPEFRAVDVVVTDSSGRPLVADVSPAPARPDGYPGLSVTTDAKGRARLYVRPGLRLRLQATYFPEDGGPETASADVDAGRPVPTVRLVVTPAEPATPGP